ncbi:3-ketoacyl-CoA synthase 11-like [Euphorbia lathyris]|uniref:3-ketoacyl-CoA synthase 11-like n=1 Tax=Euphorbia lathyris TaxID=212925 RepID=UPI003313700D
MMQLFIIPFLTTDFSNLQHLLPIITGIAFIATILTLYIKNMPRKVYLVDFSCYKPEAVHKLTKEKFIQQCSANGWFSQESLGFKKKILEKSGIGQMSYVPQGLMKIPVDMSMAESRRETESVMFGAIDELLTKTGVQGRDIGIVVVNSSIFNPLPSLSAVIVNQYKLRSDVLSYNLGGMGCSASLIAIDLARYILQGRNCNTYALVVSTENITRNLYTGNHRPMLVTNCLFRMGASAILLSNRSSDHRRSKYNLLHTVRTNIAADDKSYNCILQEHDQNEILGVSLSKDLTAVASQALKANITTLGPLVLPYSEQFLFLANLIGRKLLKLKIKSYVPNFKLAFEHFCVHPGGRGVLDEIEKQLELTELNMEPSRMTLYRFGNTSSSSLWYELAYCEAKWRMKKGDRVWQLGFGSGFKCNSVVWRCITTVNPANQKNPWIDEIDDFPIHVPKAAPIILSHKGQ